MKTYVTVLITTYNRENFIIPAINSVINQTYRKWKIIIVDDGSSDNTLAKADSIISKDKPVTIIQNPTNLGQSHALNIGLKHVDTPFFLQLDSDDLLFPFTLEVLMDEAELQPENVATIYGNYLKTFLDDQGKPIRIILIKSNDYHDRYQFLLSKQTLRPRFYRTSALEAIGGWPVDDPFEGRYAEDIRILLRLIEHYRFHRVNQVLYNYRKHHLNMTNQKEVYEQALDWILFDTLQRWGNKYSPVFQSEPAGWQSFTELIPKTKKSVPKTKKD
jgi:glycosyltransferase involved in cell wall biosynthesis